MRLVILIMGGVMAATSLAAPPRPARLPAHPGECVFTKVRTVTQRLEDADTHSAMPDSGSNTGFANGLWLVSYDEVDAANKSRPGDGAMICLVRIPQHCPPSDNRGRVYTATNLRTEQSWTLPDSEHMCGGA